MEEKKKTAREIIEGYQGPPVRIMEVCGTHTHEIFRLGIRKLLPPQVELISGPGCPVCVTPVGFIDEAVYLALEKQATICTFGDLVRVPGTKKSLADARAEGARIRIVYSPADAEKYAKEHPKEQVVFLSVGFETTTPAGCLSVKKAREDGLSNYSLLVANKTMPQAYQALKGSADVFLYPGHVNAITGTALCERLAEPPIKGKPNPACRCGDVLQGKCKPSDCRVFGKVCTPQHPVGACMVSNEGACSAYFMYGN